MVTDIIFLDLKLEVDASRFCICSKICLTLSSNACVSSSSLDNMLMVKHIQVPDYQFHFLHHHIQVFQICNPSVLMLSFMLILFLKNLIVFVLVRNHF